MMVRGVTLSLIFCTAAMCYAQAETKLVQVCRTTGTAPKLDGTLEAKEWANAFPISGFQSGTSCRLVPYQTTVRALWTPEALYLGVQLDDPEPGKLSGSCKIRDGEIWWNPCLEFFIQPAGIDSTYYHLIVNCDNVVYDGMKLSSAWNGAWSSATGRNARGWTIEMKVPFRVLGVPTPADREVWRINYCRNGTLDVTLASWTNTGQQDYHQPDKFGYLCFINGGANFPTDEDLKAVEGKVGNPLRMSVEDGLVETDPAGKADRTTYDRELKSLIGGLAEQLGELKRLDLTKVKSERRKQLDTVAAAYDRYQREHTVKGPASIADWVTGQLMLGTVSRDMESLYWQIKLDVLYGELSK